MAFCFRFTFVAFVSLCWLSFFMAFCFRFTFVAFVSLCWRSFHGFLLSFHFCCFRFTLVAFVSLLLLSFHFGCFRFTFLLTSCGRGMTLGSMPTWRISCSCSVTSPSLLRCT
jgi:hypothetical protein